MGVWLCFITGSCLMAVASRVPSVSLFVVHMTVLITCQRRLEISVPFTFLLALGHSYSRGDWFLLVSKKTLGLACNYRNPQSEMFCRYWAVAWQQFKWKNRKWATVLKGGLKPSKTCRLLAEQKNIFCAGFVTELSNRVWNRSVMMSGNSGIEVSFS